MYQVGHCLRLCYGKDEPSAISGFCRDVDEICALVGCYTV